MSHAYNKKMKTTNNGRDRTAKLRKNQNARREENLQILENIRSRLHETSEDEKKKSNLRITR